MEQVWVKPVDSPMIMPEKEHETGCIEKFEQHPQADIAVNPNPNEEAAELLVEEFPVDWEVVTPARWKEGSTSKLDDDEPAKSNGGLGRGRARDTRLSEEKSMLEAWEASIGTNFSRPDQGQITQWTNNSIEDIVGSRRRRSLDVLD